MNEIKFRMWNSYIKKYHYEINTVMECLKQQIIYNESCKPSSVAFDHISEGCVFEQYTGFKDKYNIDIFEGDIIEVGKYGTVSKKRGVIEFQQGLFGVKFKTGTLVDLATSGFKSIEIVGNIHTENITIKNFNLKSKNKEYDFLYEGNNPVQTILINLLGLGISIPSNLSDLSEWKTIISEYKTSVIKESGLLEEIETQKNIITTLEGQLTEYHKIQSTKKENEKNINYLKNIFKECHIIALRENGKYI